MEMVLGLIVFCAFSAHQARQIDGTWNMNDSLNDVTRFIASQFFHEQTSR